VTGHEDEATFTEERGSIEDRGQVRYHVDLNVTVDSDSNFYAATVTNLSAGGIFIATHIVHPAGTKFNLSVHLGDIGIVKGVGEVRWIRVQDEESGQLAGLGIRFLQLEGDGAERIKSFLEMRRPLIVTDR
jgi:uncharacterized protein (TIGR02266 family)